MPVARSLLVIHHDPIVGLDRLEPSLAARDLDLVHVDATTDDLPDPTTHDGVLILGGRDSVADADDLPDFVDAELEFLRAAAASEVPVFGICLGAQLLALAHGGTVATRETPEVAMVAVHRTTPGTTDPVTAGWPDGAPSLAHHNDEVIMLPDQAEQLLVGTDGPTMWRLGSAHATQLHPEAGVETVARWNDELDPEMHERAGVDLDEFMDSVTALDAQARAAGTSLVLRWVDGLE